MRRTLQSSGNKSARSSLLLSISASFVIGCFVSSYSAYDEARGEQEVSLVRVLVPAEPVPAGTRGSDIPLTEIDVRADSLDARSIRFMQSYLDARTVVPLAAHTPMRDFQFARIRGEHNPVLSKIPEGMRAITLRVDVTSAVEGWAGSGSSVDVLLIQDDTTSVIAENVKILSAQRSVAPIADEVKEVPQTVTILVKQEQALAIVTAEPRGRIAFALRPLEDKGDWTDKVYTASRLLGSAKKRKPVEVSGYVRYKDDQGEPQQYALAEGKWITADAVPAGVLLGDEK